MVTADRTPPTKVHGILYPNSDCFLSITPNMSSMATPGLSFVSMYSIVKTRLLHCLRRFPKELTMEESPVFKCCTARAIAAAWLRHTMLAGGGPCRSPARTPHNNSRHTEEGGERAGQTAKNGGRRGPERPASESSERQRKEVFKQHPGANQD